MKKTSEKMQRKLDKRSLARQVKISINASREKKAEQIVVLDLKGISSFTDYFVIMQGNSKRQNMAIYESIEQELKKENIRPLSIEGRENAEWILMDYGYFIIHIFSKEAREYYYLEKLWGDAPRADY
jgi:ribosome-associated protein